MADIEVGLFNEGRRVVCIVGEGGVGKTRFANALFGRMAPSFKSALSVYLPPHGLLQDVEDLLLSNLLSRSGDVTPRGLSPDALLNEFVRRMAVSETACLIDNAESLPESWLRALILKWLQSDTVSVLILTTRDSPLKPEDELTLGFSRFLEYQLKGLHPDDHRSILTLLGTELSSVYTEKELLDVARTLSYVPQRLLYLRWVGPRSREQLQELAERLSTGEVVRGPVENVVARASGGVVPFLALSRVRALRFDESLLASLWDRLGGGSTKSFVSMRNLLVEQGVLSQSGIDDSVYLNPAVHVQLEKYVSRELAPEQLAQIEFHIANYYKTVATEAVVTDAEVLNEYVYHSARARNLTSAVKYLLTRSWLARLRRNGQVLGARRIIETARRELPDQPEETSPADPYESRRGLNDRLALELGHALCDLSDYRGALSALDVAEEGSDGWAEDEHRAAFREHINYRRAICLGDSGRLDGAAVTYLRLVHRSLKTRRLTDVSVESLGYAAMILSYLQQVPVALMLGDLSVQLAERLNLEQVIACNSCSLGQALLNSGDHVLAAERLARAEHLVGPSGELGHDRREFGRILVAKAAVLTASGELDDASLIASEAIALNEDVGDRRRVGRAISVKGAVAVRTGDLGSAADLFNTAIRTLLEVGDLFNALVAGFCLGYARSALLSAEGTLEDQTSEQIGRPFGQISVRDYPWSTVADYWVGSYGPQLLGLPSDFTSEVSREVLAGRGGWLERLGISGDANNDE